MFMGLKSRNMLLKVDIIRRRCLSNEPLGRLSVIGGGNMAEAIIKAVLINGKHNPSDIIVSDPNSDRRNTLTLRYGIETTNDSLYAAKNANIVLLAAKPQNLDTIALELSTLKWEPTQTMISILAGTNLNTLYTSFPSCSK